MNITLATTLPLLVLLALGACSEPKKPSTASTSTQPASQPVTKKRSDPKKQPLKAMAMKHHQIIVAIGAHRVESKSTLQLLSKKGHRKIRQRVVLRADGAGNFAARKNTHRQHGQEAILLDGWLYSRHRYSKFIKRRPRKGEASQRADTIYGLLPAYIELLGRAIKATPGKVVDYQGSKAIELVLALSDKPRPPAVKVNERARWWRKLIEVKKIAGRALLHEATGVPLDVKIEARWSLAPPANSSMAPKSKGIPTAFSKDRDEMTLEFSQRLTIGKVPKISAPPVDDVLADSRRLRLEMERQFITGERSMPDNWPEVLVLPEPGRRRKSR